MSDSQPEVLVNVSLRLPQLGNNDILADHLASLMRAAVAAGGMSVNVSIQPFDPDADE